MKPKIPNTIQIRFPEAPVVLHTSYFREDIVTRVLMGLVAVLVISYVTFVSMTIVNVIARKEALEKMTETSSLIAQLEHDYFARTESLTVAQADERGLAPVVDKQYVQRLTAVGIAEKNAPNGI